MKNNIVGFRMQKYHPFGNLKVDMSYAFGMCVCCICYMMYVLMIKGTCEYLPVESSRIRPVSTLDQPTCFPLGWSHDISDS